MLCTLLGPGRILIVPRRYGSGLSRARPPLQYIAKHCLYFPLYEVQIPDICITIFSRDEDPKFFSSDPDPDLAHLEKKIGSGSGSDLNSK